MTQPQVPFVDPGNALLGQVPAQLATGTVTPPGGQKTGVLTIRTASTTLTVMLGGKDLAQWADLIADLARDVAGGGLTVPSPAETAAVLNRNGRRPLA